MKPTCNLNKLIEQTKRRMRERGIPLSEERPSQLWAKCPVCKDVDADREPEGSSVVRCLGCGNKWVPD